LAEIQVLLGIAGPLVVDDTLTQAATDETASGVPVLDRAVAPILTGLITANTAAAAPVTISGLPLTLVAAADLALRIEPHRRT
jgi:hypothetical protein